MVEEDKNKGKVEIIHKYSLTVRYEITHKYELPKLQRLAFIFPVLYELIVKISQFFM